MLVEMIGKTVFLGRAVFDVREGVLVENDRHLAEMTDSLFVGRQQIISAKRAVLDHCGKTPFLIPSSR
jgi:hypothetical protein